MNAYQNPARWTNPDNKLFPYQVGFTSPSHDFDAAPIDFLRMAPETVGVHGRMLHEPVGEWWYEGEGALWSRLKPDGPRRSGAPALSTTLSVLDQLGFMFHTVSRREATESIGKIPISPRLLLAVRHALLRGLACHLLEDW